MLLSALALSLALQADPYDRWRAGVQMETWTLAAEVRGTFVILVQKTDAAHALVRVEAVPGLLDSAIVSSVEYTEFDCASGRSRALSGSYYGAQNLQGSTIAEESAAQDWETAEAGKTSGRVQAFVCGGAMAGLTRKEEAWRPFTWPGDPGSGPRYFLDSNNYELIGNDLWAVSFMEVDAVVRAYDYRIDCRTRTMSMTAMTVIDIPANERQRTDYAPEQWRFAAPSPGTAWAALRDHVCPNVAPSYTGSGWTGL